MRVSGWSVTCESIEAAVTVPHCALVQQGMQADAPTLATGATHLAPWGQQQLEGRLVGQSQGHDQHIEERQQVEEAAAGAKGLGAPHLMEQRLPGESHTACEVALSGNQQVRRPASQPARQQAAGSQAARHAGSQPASQPASKTASGLTQPTRRPADPPKAPPAPVAPRSQRHAAPEEGQGQP